MFNQTSLLDFFSRNRVLSSNHNHCTARLLIIKVTSLIHGPNRPAPSLIQRMSRSATSPDLIPMRVEVYHNNIAHARIVLGTWLGFHGPSHHLGGCPHGCGTVRDGLQNDRSCTDLGTVANGYVSKDGRACTYQNVSADLGMSILTLALARTTESNAVQQGATIPNNGRFTDDNSGGMVQHYGPADRGRGVDINAKGRRCLTLQPEGNEARHFARHARCLAPSSSRGTMQNECSESFLLDTVVRMMCT
mmetsp:Transcript_11870/g.24536  ORF Transcript_11870/g.24536 Transcript_11870/m.24536 type:complete len:248 (-) Transcript_11870:750-1493(-)